LSVSLIVDSPAEEAFSPTVFATDPSIRSYTSEIVLDVAKWTTKVPLEVASASER